MCQVGAQQKTRAPVVSGSDSRIEWRALETRIKRDLQGIPIGPKKHQIAVGFHGKRNAGLSQKLSEELANDGRTEELIAAAQKKR